MVNETRCQVYLAFLSSGLSELVHFTRLYFSDIATQWQVNSVYTYSLKFILIDPHYKAFKNKFLIKLPT